MKNNITEIVFILDRSGSMSGFEADTIGGFNATIEKQKEQDGKVYVSTVLFDNESEVVNNAPEATFARRNSRTSTVKQPRLDGVSRTHKTGAAHPSILACTNHSRQEQVITPQTSNHVFRAWIFRHQPRFGTHYE